MEDFSIKTGAKPCWQHPRSPEQPNAVISHPFSKDTISSAAQTSKKRDVNSFEDESSTSRSFKDSLKATINWFYSFVYSNDTNGDLKTKDTLEIKTERHAKAKQHFINDMMKLHDHIAALDEQYKELFKDGNMHSKETLILKLLILSIKNQITQREDQNLIALSKVNKLQNHTGALRKTENEIQERLEGLNQRHNIASKLETASMVVAGTIAVATLTVAGSAFVAGSGVFLTTAEIVQGVFAYSALKTGATVGAMQSVSTFFSGYTKGKANEQIQESYLVDAQKELAKDGIHVEMDLLKKGYQDITQMYAMLRKHAEQQKDASSSMFSR